MLLSLWLFLTAFLAQTYGQCSTPSWGYAVENGPETACWDIGDCQTGSKQSPIDIPPYHLLTREEKWLPFQFINWHEHAEKWLIYNSGKTINIETTREDCKGYPRVGFSLSYGVKRLS